ncbi:MAG: 4-(cytidine 5'-diphospho)-2-C-methyl-D-erythritol kinase, partial [Acidobacteriia bacterium]|nr:4-(cytidine 5'-diphospho)-2-C-methyl-D-erythritol kinase [Terriglobia bacterium]
MSRTRRASVRALAKINLDLRVLGKRPDGYHEIRTVFQTISLGDSLELAYQRGPRSSIELDDPLGIKDNLAAKAAELAMEAMGASGHVKLRLRKQIPMGAGLGGGSSDAAAVLLALPVLAGRSIPLTRLLELGTALGSDVPF